MIKIAKFKPRKKKKKKKRRRSSSYFRGCMIRNDSSYDEIYLLEKTKIIPNRLVFFISV